MRSFILFTFTVLFCTNSFSQNLGPADLLERGEVDDQIGYLPRTLESLVGSSTLIVSGRFGEHLLHEGFYGYDDTRQSFKERLDLTDDQVERLAIPKSDYTIVVDEVLLGNISGSTIVYRIYESPPAYRKYTDPSVDRLYFLVENPDGTYSPLGPASVLNRRDGTYYFDALTQYPGEFMGLQLDFLVGVSAEVFVSMVKEEIARQYGSN